MTGEPDALADQAARFDLRRLLQVLEAHRVRYVVIGGIAAIASGVPTLTTDLDVTPARDAHNLERTAFALRELGARIRTRGEPAGVPFPADAAMLSTASVWTLTTPAGDLDLVLTPAGTGGYEDLRRRARRLTIDGMTILVADLADVIRTKEASGRVKDQRALPLLRETLEAIRERERRPSP